MPNNVYLLSGESVKSFFHKFGSKIIDNGLTYKNDQDLLINLTIIVKFLEIT